MNVLYRYDFRPWSDYSIQVYCKKFKVIKKTAKGRWISMSEWTEEKKFVLDGDGKRFAYSTKEKAWYGFERRKRSEASILRGRISMVERAIELIEKNETPPSQDYFNYNWDSGELSFLELQLATV